MNKFINVKSISQNGLSNTILLFQTICLYLLILVDPTSNLSLDTTAYAHISNQISQNNFHSIFNLTWSTLTPFFASFLHRIGFEILTSLALVQFIFCILTLYLLNKLIFRSTKDYKILLTAIPLYTVLVFEICTATSEPAFLFFLILGYYFTKCLYENPSSKFQFFLIITSILAGLARPVGIYIFSLIFILHYILVIYRQKEALFKNRFLAVCISYILFIFIWGTLMGKQNQTGFTIGKAGVYGQHLISPINGNTIAFNSRDKWPLLAKVYHSDIAYNPNHKMIINNRKIEQWRWLDISIYIGIDFESWPKKWKKENIIFMFKYYISNIYVFFKDYTLWMFAFFIMLFSNFKKFDHLKWLIILCAYINMFFITHIEFRYLIPGFILLIILLFNEHSIRIWNFSKFQILILLNIALIQLFFTKSFDIIKQLKNPIPHKPYFVSQKFNNSKPINYISRGNINSAFLIVNNTNIYFKGSIDNNIKLGTIKDTTLSYLFFKHDTAIFMPIKEASKLKM